MLARGIDLTPLDYLVNLKLGVKNSKGLFGSRDVKLRFEIKLLTDYSQNIVEGGMSKILDYFCLVQ